MRLLLDANLSPRLVASLRVTYPEVTHVETVGLATASDAAIRRWAKTHDYLICSKDSDFYHYAILQGRPKVIWLRFGNCFTKVIHRELVNNLERVRQFSEDRDQMVLILGEQI